MKRRTTYGIVIVLAVVASVFVLSSRRERSSEETKDGFLLALDRHDWKKVLDGMPESERANWPSDEKAIVFLDRIASRLPRDAFADPKVRKLPPQPVANVDQYEICFPHLAYTVDGSTYANYFLLGVMHSRDGWKTSVDTFPFILGFQAAGTRAERLNALADDMDAAGMARFIGFPMKSTTTPARLRLLARLPKGSGRMFVPPLSLE